MEVRIDPYSGCCNGVRRAIRTAEEYLETNGRLNCLGAIVHNGAEIGRLAGKGLVTVDYPDLPSLCGKTLMIRAHGEPPSTYEAAARYGIRLIDCTCPVVLALQEKIRATYSEIRETGGRIVIFGKPGHAEVNGLVGQTGGEALVVECADDLDRLVSVGKIDASARVALFSQTTKDPDEYGKIRERLMELVPASMCMVYDTICRQVSSRHARLEQFADECSAVLFVAGKESSNGKVLYELCRKANPRTFLVESIADIPADMLRPDDVVGICGATSTTRWQLEKIAGYLNNL